MGGALNECIDSDLFRLQETMQRMQEDLLALSRGMTEETEVDIDVGLEAEGVDFDALCVNDISLSRKRASATASLSKSQDVPITQGTLDEEEERNHQILEA